MAEKYRQEVLEAEEVMKRLENASPLQASKVLIDMELHDQKESLEILNGIYQDFKTNQNVVDELITPIGLNVLDSIITHKSLKLNRTGLTATRLWSEIKGFEYSSATIKAEVFSAKQQLEAMREPSEYKRSTIVQDQKLKKHKESNTETDGSIKNEIDGSDLNRESNSSSNDSVDTDHLESAKSFSDKYGGNPFISDKDLKDIANHDDNLASISAAQNRSKNAGTFQDIKDRKDALLQRQEEGNLTASEQKELDKINDKFPEGSLEAGIELENEASQKNFEKMQKVARENALNNKAHVAKKAGIKAAEQTGYQALGHAIILLIKPVFYELNDAIKFGIEKGVGAKSVTEGLKIRFNRVLAYLKKEVIPLLKKSLGDFCQNFFKVLIDGIMNLVTGLFKSLMKILSEGFSALVGAFKILAKSDDEMSKAEKSDTILKLFSATVVTFVVFYFESTIVSAIPIDFLKDIILSLLSGVASTIVVYMLDKADFFSVKLEKRTKAVKDIFEQRIRQIKENTDAFEAATIEKLAKDRLKFKLLSDELNQAIESNDNPNQAIDKIADFMKLDLKIKSTDDFIHLLESESVLVIN
ncbi:hypothetical protein [Thalassotalea aquiviva]|uniref:hypothetical protein n=1 Tax=Thalassotalea aquiviva TaxID=3242415 RepID=UPI00352BB245